MQVTTVPLTLTKAVNACGKHHDPAGSALTAVAHKIVCVTCTAEHTRLGNEMFCAFAHLGTVDWVASAWRTSACLSEVHNRPIR